VLQRKESQRRGREGSKKKEGKIFEPESRKNQRVGKDIRCTIIRGRRCDLGRIRILKKVVILVTNMRTRETEKKTGEDSTRVRESLDLPLKIGLRIGPESIFATCHHYTPGHMLCGGSRVRRETSERGRELKTASPANSEKTRTSPGSFQSIRRKSTRRRKREKSERKG